MKALVTGGTGFIGSHVVDHLLEKDYEVRCLVRTSSNLRWLKSSDIELFYGTLTDAERIQEAVQGMDLVIHVAGSLIEKDWNGFYNSNVKPVRLMLDALKSSKTLKKFVLVSSTGAVGPSPDGRPLTEDDPPNPVSDYGRSKLQAEQVARTYFDELPISIVRPSAVYGPRDPNFIIIFKQVRFGVTPLLGGEEHYANLIHAKDLARGILMAAESDKSSGQTYTLTSSRPIARSELMNTVGDVYGRRARALILPKAPALLLAKVLATIQKKVLRKEALLDAERLETIAQRYWVFDAKKAKVELGFEENYSLAEGLRETYQFYLEHGWMDKKSLR